MTRPGKAGLDTHLRHFAGGRLTNGPPKRPVTVGGARVGEGGGGGGGGGRAG